MENLSDDTLLDAYFKAIKLKLNNDFIRILKEEIDKRGLNVRDFYLK